MKYENSKEYVNENRVCMLTRSVNVKGGYILNRGKQGDNFKTQIENVRLEEMGDKKKKSIIFSQNNQIPQSSFKNNVVMNCKNRALDMYQVNQLKVEKNLMYNNTGVNIRQSYCQENELNGNTIVNAKPSLDLKKSDRYAFGVENFMSTVKLIANRIQNADYGVMIYDENFDSKINISGVISNMRSSGIYIKSRQSKMNVSKSADQIKQKIEKMNIFKTGRAIDVRESKDIELKDIELNDNQENILVDEQDSWVVIKNVKIKAPQMNNKTIKGLRLAQNGRIKIDGVDVKGFDQNKSYVIEQLPVSKQYKDTKNQKTVQFKNIKYLDKKVSNIIKYDNKTENVFKDEDGSLT